jgi:hypothetical protein
MFCAVRGCCTVQRHPVGKKFLRPLQLLSWYDFVLLVEAVIHSQAFNWQTTL